MKKLVALTAAALTTLCTLTVTPAARAAEDADYKAAVELYGKRDYAAAADKFWKAITAGNSSATTYLYMAHAYYGAQNIYEALNTYHSIVDLFKGSPEATQAATCIKRIDPANLWRRDQPLPKSLEPKTPPAVAKKSNVVSTASSTGGGASAASNAGAPNMLNRITVLPPRKGHPPVSGETLRIVKQAIQSMPASLNKICADGNVNIFLLTNSSDKWPESIDQVKADETVYAQEEGHTYGRDVYIYERPVVEAGSFTLGPAFKPETIRWSTLYQLFHGVDACMNYSKDPALDEAYKQDMTRVLDDKKKILADNINAEHGAADTFADLAVALLGVRGPATLEVERHFPLTKIIVKKKLGL